MAFVVSGWLIVTCRWSFSSDTLLQSWFRTILLVSLVRWCSALSLFAGMPLTCNRWVACILRMSSRVLKGVQLCFSTLLYWAKQIVPLIPIHGIEVCVGDIELIKVKSSCWTDCVDTNASWWPNKEVDVVWHLVGGRLRRHLWGLRVVIRLRYIQWVTLKVMRLHWLHEFGLWAGHLGNHLHEVWGRKDLLCTKVSGLKLRACTGLRFFLSIETKTSNILWNP